MQGYVFSFTGARVVLPYSVPVLDTDRGVQLFDDARESNSFSLKQSCTPDNGVVILEQQTISP